MSSDPSQETVNPDWTLAERDRHFREQRELDLKRQIEAEAAERGIRPPADKIIVHIVQ